MKAEDFLKLLIKYYKGDMSLMKLSDELGLNFSQTKIYVEQIEKILIDEHVNLQKLFTGL